MPVERYGALDLRPSKGAIDWFDLMVPEMENMNVRGCPPCACMADARKLSPEWLKLQVLSASLTVANFSEGIAFEIDLDELSASLPERP